MLRRDLAAGEKRAAAALEVELEPAVVQHAVRTGGPTHPSVGARPRQKGAVRVRRIGSGKGDHPTTRIAQGPKPVDRARQGKLRTAESLDEVTATNSARLLHRAQHRVQGGEASGPSLRHDSFAGQDSVALKQNAGRGVQSFRRSCSRADEFRDERPASRGTRLGESRQARPVRGPASDRTEEAERSKRVIRHLARPDQVPERVEDRLLIATATCVVEVAKKARAARLQMLSQALVKLANRRVDGLGDQARCVAA